MSIRIPICTGCGRAAFPRRLLCPDCGGSAWRDEPVGTGVLEAVTQRGDVRVGAVRTPVGPLLIARVEATHDVGDEVQLDEDGTVPVAR